MRSLFKIILLFNLAGIIVSCEGLEDLTGEKDVYQWIDTEYYEMDFEVKPASKAGMRIFTEEFFDSDIQKVLDATGVNTASLEQVILSEARVRLRETENYEDFDILKFIELTLYTDDKGETRVAWSDPVPVDKNELIMDVSDSDVLKYFTEDKFMLTAQGYVKQGINKEMLLNARAKFRIRVKIN